MTTSAAVYNLKLFASTIVSQAALGTGFLLLSLPTGLILKITGVTLEVFGFYGCYSVYHVMQNQERFTDENKEELATRFKSRLTNKALALNIAIIGMISSCYLITYK